MLYNKEHNNKYISSKRSTYFVIRVVKKHTKKLVWFVFLSQVSVFASAMAPLLSITVNVSFSFPIFLAPVTAGKPSEPTSPAIRILLARVATCKGRENKRISSHLGFWLTWISMLGEKRDSAPVINLRTGKNTVSNVLHVIDTLVLVNVPDHVFCDPASGPLCALQHRGAENDSVAVA